MVLSRPTVELIRFDVVRDLHLLRVWLARQHGPAGGATVRRPSLSSANIPPTDQALIAVAARTVGYLCWQRLGPEELAAAGLSDLPPDLIDVDILIGELDFVGRGIGPQALRCCSTPAAKRLLIETQ